MEKDILIYASFDNQKYYFNPEHNDLPEDIKKELKVISISLSNEIKGAFSIGFYKDGSVVMNAIEETDVAFDHIGANIIINNIEKDHEDILKKLTLWYRVFKTDEGKLLKEEYLKNNLGEL